MNTEASRKLVLDYLAAQGRGDGATMAALLDEKVATETELAAPARITNHLPSGDIVTSFI